MSFDSLLINEVLIERYTSAFNDDYGTPIKTFSTHLEIWGRISYPKGRQIQRDTEIIPVEAVLFLEDEDVTEYDRVTVDGILFEILFVAELQDFIGEHHKELSLKRIIA